MPDTMELGAALAAYPVLKGAPGAGVSIRVSGGFIQSKRDDETVWSNLLSVASITGAGGKSVEVQVVGTALQARQTGGSWATVFDLSTLTGATGPAGKSVELQVSGTALQARQTGGNWATVYDLAALKGVAGAGVSVRVSAGYIQTKRDDETVWSNLLSVASITGAGGKSVEVQVVGTALQARQTGGNWATVFDLSTLQGARGAPGANGVDAGLYSPEEPGEGLRYFTADETTKEPVLYADLGAAGVVTTSEGRALRLTGAGWILSKRFYRLRPGDTYRVTAGWIRSLAPEDPSGDAVRVGVLLYDYARGTITDLVLREWANAPISARQTHTAFISRIDLGIPDVKIVPPTTRYARPYVRTFGGAQATDVEFLAWDAGSGSGSSGGAGGTAEAAAWAAQARGFRDQTESLTTQTMAYSASASVAATSAAAYGPGKLTEAQLRADLAWPDGTVRQVIADPGPVTATGGNGTYRKAGAVGAGTWSKESDLTLYSLDGLTRDVREAVRIVLEQSGFVWTDEFGFPCLRADATGLSFPGAATSIGDFAGLRFADEFGFVPFGIDGRGVTLADVAMGSYAGGAFALADEFGFIGFSVSSTGGMAAGSIEMGDTPASSYSAAEMAERGARALALSASIRDGGNARIAAPVWSYTHLILYGQSLGNGTEAWPAKSKTPRPDVLMLGDAVRPGPQDSTDYPPVGSAVLKPLRAVVQSEKDNGGIFSDADVGGLPAGHGALGETPMEGAARFARRLWLQHHGLAADPSRVLVASSCAIGGKTIEELSKGASPERFNRVRDCATRVKTIAAGEGKSYGIGALFWMQGEYNYAQIRGGTSDKAAYKALLSKLYDDVIADVVGTIAGQADPPPMITYQTTGAWATDTLSIGQAQFELSLERAGWYLAAPSYPYPDKGGHLEANGSRWIGLQMGKVFHEVAVRRRGWRPTSPLRATYRGAGVLIDFHAPVPPLQFQPFWQLSQAVDYADKGFVVTDALGAVAITSIAIVQDVLVSITCARTLVAPVSVSYARKTTFSGGGNLCDSDPTIAPDVFEYVAGSGDYPEFNIPSLVGKPYPLNNWCVAFTMPATAN